MRIFRLLTIAVPVLAAACAPMGESGWIRVTGAMVESDGRQIKNCRLAVFDAATDQRLVETELNGRFDEQLYPRQPAQAYYFVATCKAFREKIKLGPYDTGAAEWTQPLDLGDIVFRRIPG